MSRKMDFKKRLRPRNAGRFIVVREELILLTRFREMSASDKAHLQRIAAAFACMRRK